MALYGQDSSPTHKLDAYQILLIAAQKLNETPEIPVIMHQLIISALDLTNSAGGMYGLKKNDKLVFTKYIDHNGVRPIDYSFSKGYGVHGWVMEHCSPYYSNDSEHDPYVVPEIQKTLGFYNLADVPILSRSGELLGSFEIHNTLDRRPFTEEDIKILTILANMAALAIENARLIEHKDHSQAMINHRLEFEEIIAKLSSDFINMKFDEIDSQIKLALQAVAEFFCVDRSYIFQYSNNHKTMSNTHEWCRKGIAPHIDRLQNIPVEAFPWIDERLKRFEIIQVDRVEEMPSDAEAEKTEFKLESILSIVIVPMVCRGKLVGFIGLDTVLYEALWNKEVIALLRLVGEIFANALDRKRSEEALRDSEQRYRELIETMNEGIGMTDENYVFTYVNAQLARMLGYARDEMIGRHLTSFLNEENKRLMESQIAKRRKGESGLFELAWTTRDGKEIYTLISPKGFFDESGNFKGSMGVLTDITDRKIAENQLKESEERFRSLVETTSDFIWEVNQDGIYTYVSPKVKDLLGYEPQECLGKTPFHFMPADEAQKVASQFLDLLEAHEPFANLENINCHKDGRLVVLETSGVPVFDGSGKFCGYRGVDRDITERKHFQARLQDLNRELDSKNKELEAILYAAAHDLRSPLVNITGFSHELSISCDQMCSAIGKTPVKLDDEVLTIVRQSIPESLNYITSSIGKMDSLISGLLKVSRLGVASQKIETLDMNTIILDILKSFEYQTKEKGAIVEVGDFPACVGDESQVTQIFLNLLTNAIKFLDPSRQGVIKITGSVNDSESIYIVSDNGIGIAKQHQDKIFGIFYRLEPEKTSGEGLGLTIVRRLAERNNGKIWVESEPGKGSKFFVSLPAARGVIL